MLPEKVLSEACWCPADSMHRRSAPDHVSQTAEIRDQVRAQLTQDRSLAGLSRCVQYEVLLQGDQIECFGEIQTGQRIDVVMIV